MTDREKAEIIRRAIQDAVALRSGWPVRGNPYQEEAADLYEEAFQAELKRARK